MKLRPYQQAAVTATIRHFKSSSSPACIVLPTGAGKSLVIAELARLAQGRVLVVAHVKELCEQNHQKFIAMGGQAGVYSAGLGEKDSSQKVTFGSVQSIVRNLTEFKRNISLLIIDECHRVSGEDGSQYARLIEALRSENPALKVLGLTATPYRLGLGWCYQKHAAGFARTAEPRPFVQCVFELSLREMIRDKYLTEPRVEDTPIAQYDFSALELNRFGEPVTREVNELLVRHKRVTRAIVEQIVELTVAENRRGVMIFAATVDHAREIADLLPEPETALILGETASSERDQLVRRFAANELRYLVNVAVLTTGFDAPHVDFIAILRATQSISLYQQIVGRGLRLAPEKKDCLVMDYAGNGYDIYAPEVGETKPNSESVTVSVKCPNCEFDNSFWGLTDSEGHVVEHYGRRCHGLLEEGEGTRQCDFRFRFKECEKCQAENDIAARRCHGCEGLLVDPDDLLKRALGLKDALVLRVSGMQFFVEGTKLKVTYHDEDGASVSERFDFSHPAQLAAFNRVFARRLASGRSPLELELPEQAVTLRALMPTPDFVVARKHKIKGGRAHYFRVKERVFDYAGRYRLAFAT